MKAISQKAEKGGEEREWDSVL